MVRNVLPKILVVDDVKSNLVAMGSALEDVKAECVFAESGKEALHLCLEEDFALILLDVQMPEMDGFEVASHLKARRETSHIPIIFVTAISKEQKYILKGHEVGAVDYLMKPIDPLILTSKVNTFLEYYKQQSQMKETIEDLSDKKKKLARTNTKLSSLARHDSLTGLYNRHSFDKYLGSYIDLARKNKAIFALLFLDLDNFKYVNDNYGHDIGDELLKMVAQRIKRVVRDSDIISQNNQQPCVSRIGGDEFALLICEIQSPEDASKISQRIIDNVSKDYYVNDIRLHIGVSIGIACYPISGESPQVLRENADHAMYEAKYLGKEQYCFFSEEIERKHKVHVELEKIIKSGSLDKEFYIEYQPIVRLADNRIVGVEVLCRWENKILGKVAPSEFIYAAELNKSILPLGEWIFSEALNSLNEVIKKTDKNIYFAVNLSGLQLKDDHFMEQVRNAVKQDTKLPSLLEFEITESFFVESIKDFQGNIEDIASLGISTAIDDFGTGYSSLKRLGQLPIRTLKLDRSIINEINIVPEKNSMIVPILDLAKTLDMHVVAEGIETKVQAEFFRDCGCDYAQGFYFYKPMALSDFINIVLSDLK